MTDEELDELEALANAATPGPWNSGTAFCCPDMGWLANPKGKVCNLEASKKTHSLLAEDAQFIAACREAVPALISEVRRLQELICRAERDGFCFDHPEHARGCPWCGEKAFYTPLGDSRTDGLTAKHTPDCPAFSSPGIVR